MKDICFKKIYSPLKFDMLFSSLAAADRNAITRNTLITDETRFITKFDENTFHWILKLGRASWHEERLITLWVWRCTYLDILHCTISQNITLYMLIIGYIRGIPRNFRCLNSSSRLLLWNIYINSTYPPTLVLWSNFTRDYVLLPKIPA